MFRYLILALITCVAAAGCSNSQFAGLGTRSKADKKEDSGDIKDGDKTSKSNKKEAEQDLDDPQQVSGSFLTMECVQDDSLPKDASNVTVGCTVKDIDGNKADMSGATEQSWSLVSPLNFAIPAAFAESGSDSRFHRTVQAPKTFLVFHSVRVSFKKDGLDRELVDFINLESDDGNELPPPPPELPIVEVGQTEDFQLGDDAFGAGTNFDCGGRLQAVNISGHEIIAVLHVKSATAKVGISLKDLCGVTYTTNGASLRKAGTKIVGADIKRYATDHVLPGVELKQGDYELHIESRVYTDRDDFIVGKIVVASDGEVTLDRPTVPGAPDGGGATVPDPVTEPTPPVTEPTL